MSVRDIDLHVKPGLIYYLRMLNLWRRRPLLALQSKQLRYRVTESDHRPLYFFSSMGYFCGERRARSACTYVQSDLALHSPLFIINFCLRIPIQSK